MEVLKILRDFDKNNSGKIEFDDFNEVGESCYHNMSQYQFGKPFFKISTV